jgi:hypothetical protein
VEIAQRRLIGRREAHVAFQLLEELEHLRSLTTGLCA